MKSNTSVITRRFFGRRIVQWFRERPSRFYATLYLMLVPFFAGIYCLIPGQFYHSTAQYEKESLDTDANEITSTLKNEILTSMERDRGTTVIKFKGLRLDVGDVKFADLRVDDEYVKMKCYVTMKAYDMKKYYSEVEKDAKDKDSKSVEIHVVPQLSIPLENLYSFSDADGKNMTDVKDIRVDNMFIVKLPLESIFLHEKTGTMMKPPEKHAYLDINA